MKGTKREAAISGHEALVSDLGDREMQERARRACTRGRRKVPPINTLPRRMGNLGPFAPGKTPGLAPVEKCGRPISDATGYLRPNKAGRARPLLRSDRDSDRLVLPR